VIDRIVLACSGGHDTSVALRWIGGMPSKTAARRDQRLGSRLAL
jgi:argininosuccinate synthase